jgi:hypothetical protein
VDPAGGMSVAGDDQLIGAQFAEELAVAGVTYDEAHRESMMRKASVNHSWRLTLCVMKSSSELASQFEE